MADQSDNANASNAAKKSVGGSPWDDDLELPQEKPEAKQSEIIGSLDPKSAQEEKPVPFNVPEEVIQDKVAQKIPAEQVQGNAKPIHYPTEKDNRPATPVAIKPAAPEAKSANSSLTASASISSSSLSPKPTPALAQPPISSPKTAESTGSLPQPAQNNGSAPVLPKSEKGVSELVLSNDKPAQPEPKLEIDKQQLAKVEAKISSVDKIANTTAVNAPKPEKTFSTNGKSLDNLSKPLSPKVPEEPAPVIEPVGQESPKPIVIEEKANERLDSSPKSEPQPTTKRNSLIKSLFGKKQKIQPANSVPGSPVSSSSKPLAPAISSQPKKPEPKARAGIQKGPGKLAWIFAVFMIFAAAIYLTEIGMLSIGLEKIYGIAGLERLWGGLPRNLEPALASMATAEQKNLAFKFNGTIKATVDKSKNSPITTPLSDYGSPKTIYADLTDGLRVAAKTAQYDYYETETTGDTTIETDNTATEDTVIGDVSDESDVASPYTTDASETTDFNNTADAGSTAEDTYGATSDDQGEYGAYSSEASAIKQLEFDIQGLSTESSAAATLDLKPIVGSSKRTELVSSKGKLYVKSDEIKYDNEAESGKWLEYNLPGFSSENPLNDFFSVKFDSGLSARGTRVGNDKLVSGRAYHYQIYSLEFGDSLSALGIPSSAVNEISGDVWIGVKDHLLKKISIKITPSSSSGITDLSIELELKEYGNAGTITVPALDEVIAITKPSAAEPLASEEEAPAAEPEPSAPVISSARTPNDALRDGDLINIKNALNSYKKAKGRYPLASSWTNLSQPGNVLSRDLVPKYLSALPADPNAASGWWYGYKSDGKTFTLSARFENIYDTAVTEVNGIPLHYVWSWK